MLLVLLACTEPIPVDSPVRELEGDRALLELEPTSLDFGATQEPVSLDLLLRNTGGERLLIFSVEADKPFSAASLPENAIGPGEELPLTLTYAPTTFGEHAGSLHISSDDSQRRELDVALVGNRPAPAIQAEPGSIDFELVGHRCSEERPLLVSNEGLGPLTLTAFYMETISTELYVDILRSDNGSLPWTLQPGESRETLVLYEPNDVGEDEALLWIQSDDPLHGDYLVPVFGEASTTAPCSG